MLRRDSAGAACLRWKRTKPYLRSPRSPLGKSSQPIARWQHRLRDVEVTKAANRSKDC